MISLTERQEKISQYLICAVHPVAVEELSRVFNISRRSVYYDLKRIEAWASVYDLSFQRHPRKGVNIERPTEAGTNPAAAMLLSPDRRRKLLLLKLLLSPDCHLTAQDLSEAFNLSRNTILQDVKAIRESLLPEEVDLVGLRSHGYAIEGDEGTIRALAIQLIFANTLTFDLLSTLVRNQQMTDPDPFLEILFANLKIDVVKSAVKAARHVYDFWLPDLDYVRFIIYEAIAVERIQLGKIITRSSEQGQALWESEEFRIARRVCLNVGEAFDLTLPEAEVVNTFKMLLTCNIKTRTNAVRMSSPNNLLCTTVREMIEAIAPCTSFNKKAYKKLEHDLIEHLKLTLKQLQLGVVGENPLLETIRITYSQSYLLAEKMAAIFEAALGMALPQGEVGYLALHVAVYQEVACKMAETLQAVVICNGGKGAANILSKKLRIYLPELKIKGTYSILDLEEKVALLDDVDLIISTITYVNRRRPVLTISPLLSDNEIAIIKNFIQNKEQFQPGDAPERVDVPLFSTLYARLEKRTDKEAVKIFREELERIGLFWNEKFIVSHPVEAGETPQNSVTALVVLDAMNMLKSLKQIGVVPSEDETVGLLIHLIMAVGRWQKGEFAQEPQLEEMKAINPDAWALIADFLKRVRAHLAQPVPESEGVAIARYLI